MMQPGATYRPELARAPRHWIAGALLLGLAACGDPPPDIAVYVTSSTSGLQLSAQICKLADPTACAAPTPLLDGSHDKGQGGIYNLTAGQQFPLVFESPSIQPALQACRKVVVTFHQAQQVINVSISQTGIDISCDSAANCGPAVACGP